MLTLRSFTSRASRHAPARLMSAMSADQFDIMDRKDKEDMAHLTGRRGDWWWTGKAPVHGVCPGVLPDGTMTSLAMPRLDAGREEVQAYFDNTWTLTEVLFASLQGEDAFKTLPSHKLRHPLIFYYGHVAALYVNKLRVSGVVDKSLNPFIEEFFQTGVDEMSWDDLSAPSLGWPDVTEVTDYRRQVYELVSEVIAEHPDVGRPVPVPVPPSGAGADADADAVAAEQRYWQHPLWSLFLGFEHERIHLETSSVLVRELPLEWLRVPEEWRSYHESATVVRDASNMRDSAHDGSDGWTPPVRGRDYPSENRMLPAPGGEVPLGKARDLASFGWDNEYGERAIHLRPFEASEFMISNGEYYEFVQDRGYAEPRYWTEDGWQWRAFRNAKWPVWWVPFGPAGLDAFRLRLTHSEVEMPWDWPVDVNAHEARAYCAWRSEKDGLGSSAFVGGAGGDGYRLLTEPEHVHLRDGASASASASASDGANADADALDADLVLSCSGSDFAETHGVNLNLAYGSQTPVTWGGASPSGHRGVTGGAWEWAEDQFNALPGFKIHATYEDFSTPCFDGEHSMILGGSWASTGANGASRFSRFAFRPHFFQHAGFRMVRPPAGETAETMPTSCNGCAPPYRGALAAKNKQSACAETEAREVIASRLTEHYADAANGMHEMFHDTPLEALRSSPHFVHECVSLLKQLSETHGAGTGTGKKALDLGCSVGGATFALASNGGFGSVLGVDIDAAALQAAKSMAESGQIEGPAFVDCQTDAVSFMQADAMCVPADLYGFEAVLCADLLEELQSPSSVLMRMGGELGLVGRGGVLLLTSTYNYNDLTTPVEAWIGNSGDKHTEGTENAKSVQRIATILGPEFELIAEHNIPRVERVSDRQYVYTISHATSWKRCESPVEG